MFQKFNILIMLFKKIKAQKKARKHKEHNLNRATVKEHCIEI